jgi:transposase InsO family protein
VLRVYAQNSIKSATEFVEEVRRRLPMTIQRIQTDHGSEFGTDFTWHLQDLGVTHRQIPRGCPQANGKVERSHRTDSTGACSSGTPAELARKLRQWEHEYNHRRLHLALRGRTPAERLCEPRIASEPVQQLA